MSGQVSILFNNNETRMVTSLSRPLQNPVLFLYINNLDSTHTNGEFLREFFWKYNVFINIFWLFINCLIMYTAFDINQSFELFWLSHAIVSFGLCLIMTFSFIFFYCYEKLKMIDCFKKTFIIVNIAFFAMGISIKLFRIGVFIMHTV